ncbi:hypothetical protein BK128_09680 [Viridibacillus sp. FSL H7-0596]|uniref:hypothetical protein n=1 Tax=Viridibacillus sp. FSL H7-0596 TaxID=1928923 RepID=UPI00096D037C|nr:hypothetical protein [Viridibacillus sp. FSL H7-0596]OMC86924.1 hypothetical protein BK128_09680 [Viridibacillus sp. FSL H7-0596]
MLLRRYHSKKEDEQEALEPNNQNVFTAEQLEDLTKPQIEDILNWLHIEFKSKDTKTELIALVLGEEQPKVGE